MGQLILRTSSSIDALVDYLAGALPRPAGGVLDSEAVVVQSQGMAHWLRLELASRLGVCMNVDFPFPRRFLSDCLQSLALSDGADAAFEPGPLAWRIHRWLLETDLTAQPGFEAVAAYIGRDKDPRKVHQLALRVVDCLDQYAVYRPDWVCAWQAAAEGAAVRHWQATLWRELSAGGTGQHSALRMATLNPGSMGGARPGELPPRVFVVLTTLLPPAHLRMFEVLSACMDVQLLTLTIRPGWYTGATSEPPEHDALLRASARQGRELAALVSRLALPQVIEPTARDEQGTFLKALQRGWSTDSNGYCSVRMNVEEAGDPGLRSLQVHACHGPMREVEVLHDHVLHWLQNTDLQPRDILVVTPDLETYAPCIEAVFEGGVETVADAAPGRTARQKVPFTIADRTLRQNSVVADAFLRLLELEDSRLGVNAVLDLLEAEPVRRRFGVKEEHLAQISEWLQSSGVRWGWDGEARKTLGLPGVEETTWKHGLDRLLLGHAMPALTPTLPVEGVAGRIIPCPVLEGEHAEVMGRIVEFAVTLHGGLGNLKGAKSLKKWRDDLGGLLLSMLDLEGEAESASPVWLALGQLAQAEDAGAGGEVSFAAVREALRLQLQEPSGMQAVFRGGVNVCGMRLMRGVPFRVVCVLGMNDGIFPRRDERPGFDLMAAEAPRLGDPSLRHDDRHLFLQLVQSARDRFYVSYVGRSDRDNAELLPAVVVSELLEYAKARWLGSRPFVTHHALHAFDPSYFRIDASDDNPGRFSYSSSACVAARRMAEGGGSPWIFAPQVLPAPPEEARRVTVKDLQDFFCNPSAFFLKRRLLMEPRDIKEQPLVDDELFGVDHLEKFQLRQERVQELERSGMPAAAPGLVRERWVSEGRLPLGAPGGLDHAAVIEYADWLRGEMSALRPSSKETLPVNLALDGFHLVGSLEVSGAGGVFRWRPGRIRPQDYLDAWIGHLVAQSIGRGGGSVLLGEAKTPIPETKLKRPDTKALRLADDPAQKLGALLSLYWEGWKRPIPFFPKTSWAYAWALLEGKNPNPDGAMRNAKAAWLSDYPPGEQNDPAFRLCFGHLDDPLDGEFAAMAMRVFSPLIGSIAEP